MRHLEADEYARIAAVEDDHWWYRNTRGLVADFLEPWLASPVHDAETHTKMRALDAGCGPGGNGAWLARHGSVVGVDVAPEALAFVRSNRPEVAPVRATLESLPFDDEVFDVVVAITVLYTVADDAQAVHELARVLRPGGALVVVEPAFAALRRSHDAVVHGRRRYRRAELAELLRDASLVPLRQTYAYSFLAPPAAALGLAERITGSVGGSASTESSSDVERRGLDRVFAPLAGAERRYLSRRDVAFGTSAVVLATRDS